MTIDKDEADRERRYGAQRRVPVSETRTEFPFTLADLSAVSKLKVKG